MDTSRSKRPKRCKRSWGRSIRIDTMDKLNELIGLIETTLSIDMHIEIYQPRGSAFSGSTRFESMETAMVVQPLAFQPLAGNSHSIFTMRPSLIEVRVSLIIDEYLGWLLPVYFCIGELLTADEVITKISEAFWILRTWSDANTREYLQCAALANANGVH